MHVNFGTTALLKREFHLDKDPFNRQMTPEKFIIKF